MTTYEKFNNLLRANNITAYKVHKGTGIASATLSDWKNGKSEPKQDKLQKIADFFGISVSYFYESESEPIKKAPILTEKNERDIAKNLDRIMNQLEQCGDLMFDGDPMSDEARESIKAAMKLGLEAAKAKNKARFTPKKYRKD